MMRVFKAGYARTDVTPALGVRLGGYGRQYRPAESVHDNLYASSLVLEQESVKYILMSLDWLCITADVAARVKFAINEKTSIPIDNIIICTIHTHTAPNTMAIPGWGDVEYGYIESVMPAIIESAVQASQNLVPAKLGIGTVQSLVGINRRTIHEDGGMSFAGNTEGSYDPTMTVVRFVDAKDLSIATLVHYGAHNTAWSAAHVVSRDWAGVMVDRVQKQINSPVMFVNGAIGDVGPRTNCHMGDGKFSAGPGDGLDSVLEVGYRGATDALKCYFSVKHFEDSIDLKSAICDITILVKPILPIEQVKVKLAELEQFKDAWGAGRCKYEYYMRVLKAHAKPAVTSMTIESRILVVGSVAFVTLPGEPFSSISLRIRDGSPYPYTLLLSNANGSIAYIPDMEARKYGGYEVEMESAINTYLPVDNVDEIIVAASVKKLKQLHEK